MQVQPADLNFLSTSGYLSVMQKDDYDSAMAEVSNLTQMNQDLQSELDEERSADATLKAEENKTHSILFHFEGKDKKQAELSAVESETAVISKEQADITENESKITELIQKKSVMDRMIQYNGEYLALTGLGVITLNDLNVRNYRVSDSDFSDFAKESADTNSELRSIAESGNFYETNFKTEFPKADPSQLWSVSIGLAKLQGDQNQILGRFDHALDVLKQLKSTLENKMMAAEIMTAFRANPSQTSTDDSDLQGLSASLASLDKTIRARAKVPKQLSAGIAAVIMFGRKYDGTFPIDNFVQFTKITPSYESAAILSIMNVPSDQLTQKFQSFRDLFSSWGYKTSEDTELASAYLTISDLGPDDVRTKMTIIVDALKNYLEYPLVASAILTSIPTLEANETLDLMEKAYSFLGSYAVGLERSALVSLAVRMIHGVANELVKKLDPTATVINTPVQFTHAPSFIFFPYMPLIVAHSTYYSTFSGIGGAHPAHVHAVGGFVG